MKANQRIQNAMRERERSLLNHLRACEREGRPVYVSSQMWSMSWHRAWDRLKAAGKVRYKKTRYGCYMVAVKNARPVTKKAA